MPLQVEKECPATIRFVRHIVIMKKAWVFTLAEKHQRKHCCQWKVFKSNQHRAAIEITSNQATKYFIEKGTLMHMRNKQFLVLQYLPRQRLTLIGPMVCPLMDSSRTRTFLPYRPCLSSSMLAALLRSNPHDTFFNKSSAMDITPRDSERITISEQPCMPELYE